MSRPDIPFPQSPVVPTLLDESHVIRFQCHRGVKCWNACCSNIDISLTPYDVLRLARRLDLSTSEFLARFTVPYELEKDGIAGVKLKPVDGGTACRYMVPEGCSIYSDRPTACRYLRQVLFGEMSVAMHAANVERRRARAAEQRSRLEREAAERLAREEEGGGGID